MSRFIYTYNIQIAAVTMATPYESLLVQQDTQYLIAQLQNIKNANLTQTAGLQSVIAQAPAGDAKDKLSEIRDYLQDQNGQITVFISELASRADNVATRQRIYEGTPAEAKDYFDSKGIDYTGFINL